MRSISTKLILAFLGIGIISIATLFTTARSSTRPAFINYVSEQTEKDLAAQLSIYHFRNGSWNGVESIFLFRDGPKQPGFGPMHDMPDRKIVPFTLADENGNVIISNERYKAGDRVPESDLALGVPITEDGEMIGVLLPIRVPFEEQPREVEFIETANRTLLDGALMAAIIALVLGVFLSRTLTRPIRELTRATQAVSDGDLSQQVPIRSNDELGELAKAFNKMSSELSRSVNARKQMTADIAHELRTPLSLILGHAEAVHDGVVSSWDMPKPCMTASCRLHARTSRSSAKRQPASSIWSMTCGYYLSQTRESYLLTFRPWNHGGFFRMLPPCTSIRRSERTLRSN
jgi:two-component system, OmpR family, sensor histidine kinase BaeS